MWFCKIHLIRRHSQPLFSVFMKIPTIFRFWQHARNPMWMAVQIITMERLVSLQKAPMTNIATERAFCINFSFEFCMFVELRHRPLYHRNWTLNSIQLNENCSTNPTFVVCHWISSNKRESITVEPKRALKPQSRKKAHQFSPRTLS